MSSSEIGRCETCKHWGDHRDAEFGNFLVRTCYRIHDLGIFDEDNPAATTEPGADLECYSHFGCVLHSPREEGCRA